MGAGDSSTGKLMERWLRGVWQLIKAESQVPAGRWNAVSMAIVTIWMMVVGIPAGLIVILQSLGLTVHTRWFSLEPAGPSWRDFIVTFTFPLLAAGLWFACIRMFMMSQRFRRK